MRLATVKKFAAPPHMIKKIRGGIERSDEQHDPHFARGERGVLLQKIQHGKERGEQAKFENLPDPPPKPIAEQEGRPKREGNDGHDKKIDERARNGAVLFFDENTVFLFTKFDDSENALHANSIRQKAKKIAENKILCGLSFSALSL